MLQNFDSDAACVFSESVSRLDVKLRSQKNRPPGQSEIQCEGQAMLRDQSEIEGYAIHVSLEINRKVASMLVEFEKFRIPYALIAMRAPLPENAGVILRLSRLSLPSLYRKIGLCMDLSAANLGLVRAAHLSRVSGA